MKPKQQLPFNLAPASSMDGVKVVVVVVVDVQSSSGYRRSPAATGLLQLAPQALLRQRLPEVEVARD